MPKFTESDSSGRGEYHASSAAVLCRVCSGPTLLSGGLRLLFAPRPVGITTCPCMPKTQARLANIFSHTDLLTPVIITIEGRMGLALKGREDCQASSALRNGVSVSTASSNDHMNNHDTHG